MTEIPYYSAKADDYIREVVEPGRKGSSLTDEEYTLIVGNIRGFAAWMESQKQDGAPASSDPAALLAEYDHMMSVPFNASGALKWMEMTEALAAAVRTLLTERERIQTAYRESVAAGRHDPSGVPTTMGLMGEAAALDVIARTLRAERDAARKSVLHDHRRCPLHEPPEPPAHCFQCVHVGPNTTPMEWPCQILRTCGLTDEGRDK